MPDPGRRPPRATVSLVLACAVCAAIFLAHARALRFLQDDAFITFRYARNLVAGNGPVWNVGERVEGYTSFLWLCVTSVLFRLGVRVESGVHAVTVALGLGTLALTFALVRRLTSSRLAPVAALLLLATDRTFAIWSTSGMETRLFGFLALATSLLALRADRGRAPRDGLVLGASALLLSLARPEGLMLSALALGFVARPALARGAPRAHLATAAAPWALGVGAHLAWRRSYYDAWLPNTFYVKVDGLDLRSSAQYLLDYALSFPHHVLVLLPLAALSLRRGGDRRLRLHLAVLMGAYLAYLCAVGGDFMEFRFLDVLLPYLYALAADGLALVAASDRAVLRRGAPALAVALALANLAADRLFERRRHYVVTWLAMTATTESWRVIGEWFHRVALPGENLATPVAGALPYYAEMPCIDMLGLSDREVARQPPDPGKRIGHRKLASMEYLARRRPTFVYVSVLGATAPVVARAGGEGFWARLDNDDPRVFDGHPLCVLLRTGQDRREIMASLRARGVTVFSERCGTAPGEDEAASPH